MALQLGLCCLQNFCSVHAVEHNIWNNECCEGKRKNQSGAAKKTACSGTRIMTTYYSRFAMESRLTPFVIGITLSGNVRNKKNEQQSLVTTRDAPRVHARAGTRRKARGANGG